MKRVGLFLATISMVFLLTACGGKEKSLDCNMSADQKGVIVKQNFLLNFEGNGKFKSAVLTQDAVVSEDLLKATDLNTYKSAFEQTIKSTYKDLKYDITDNGKDTVTIKVDFKDIGSLGMVSNGKDVKASKKDFENAKKSFESAKYTCTVK
jgi:hypothetical protein